MEGKWNFGMAMLLFIENIVYNIIQQASVDPDPTPTQELDPVLEPIWAQGSLTTTNYLDLVFPFDEVIIEALAGPERP